MTAFDIEDIEFAEVSGVRLQGRLYRPRADKPVPLLVDVHGGAWTKGDRLNNQVMHRYLAEHGIATFALDFRMPPQVQYPHTVADVNAGIRWVKRHAARLGTDADLVGGLGTSSGGHLLMLNVLQPDHPLHAASAIDDDSDALLNYVVVCWPILDPLARYRMAQRRNVAQLLDAHHAFWPDERTMETANPHLIVERRVFSHQPPVLLIQGTGDENVEHFRADEFGELYRASGGAIDIRKYDDVHMFITSAPDTDNARHGLAVIKEFVHSQTQWR